MRYRTAFLGVVFGGIFIIGFAMRGGMAMWIADTIFCRALRNDRYSANPHSGANRLSRFTQRPLSDLTIASSVCLAPGESGHEILTWFALFFGSIGDNRSHPMPHQLEAFKLAERGNL